MRFLKDSLKSHWFKHDSCFGIFVFCCWDLVAQIDAFGVEWYLGFKEIA